MRSSTGTASLQAGDLVDDRSFASLSTVVPEWPGQRKLVGPLNGCSRGVGVLSLGDTFRNTLVVCASLLSKGRRPGAYDVSPVGDFHRCKWVGVMLVCLSFGLLFLPDRVGLSDVAKKLWHRWSDIRRGQK